MNKADVIRTILKDRLAFSPQSMVASAFAPSNIALCKYWGKRNAELNLPVTSSLSISLGQKGATATFKVNHKHAHSIYLNGKQLNLETSFSQRLLEFLNLFSFKYFFDIELTSNLPIAAGLASSAAGFASIVLALNELFQWQLHSKELSILARLGSGSAARSCWHGFVEWNAGTDPDGFDSHGELLATRWPDLRIGLLIVNNREKKMSSRVAMRQTVATSPFYQKWPQIVADDLRDLKKALVTQDFSALGQVAEKNAIAMHATMLAAVPSILYSDPETISAMQRVWSLRAEGLPVFFTQDAGPNLKLLFEKDNEEYVQKCFPGVEILNPFF